MIKCFGRNLEQGVVLFVVLLNLQYRLLNVFLPFSSFFWEEGLQAATACIMRVEHALIIMSLHKQHSLHVEMAQDFQ